MSACSINMEMVNLLLDLAKTYHDHATGIFNTFITVLFGSLAFSSKFPMTDFGSSKKFWNMTLSFPSLAMAGALSSFYLVSFIAFDESITNAKSAVKEILKLSSNCNPYDALKEVFNYQDSLLPQLGFIIGSVIGTVVFVWLANSRKNPASISERED
jgi:hypothetical protein